MKKVLYIGGIIALIVATVVIIQNVKGDKIISKLEIVSEQGKGIDDFYIADDKVYIVGGLTIRNNTEDELSYSLSANSEVDFQSGLIKSAVLEGFDENLSTNIFSIGGHEEQTIKVVFVGDYAGYDKKSNRLMPEIIIIEEQ